MKATAAGVLLLLVTRAASAEIPTDGVYDRFDGDLDIGVGLGAELGDGDGRGAARASAHYFSMAGAYVGYADTLRDPFTRRLAFGVDVRPMFLPRWTENLEQGPGFADLTLDSISIGLGAFFASRGRRGFEAGCGAGLPLAGSASGPWLEGRAVVLFADDGSDPRALGILTISWHALVETWLVRRDP